MPLLDLLFPKSSLTGTEGEWITKAELSSLTSHPVAFPSEALKRRGIRCLDHVYGVSTYQGCPLRKKAIHTFKYRRIPDLGQFLQELFCSCVLEKIDFESESCICPVPLHWSRRFQRGFNQAEILGRGLAKQSGLPLRNLLQRTRPTGHQSRRGRAERWRAMKGAFSVFARRGPPCHCVYLVDDLFTTGATMEECAKELKKSGVERVEGLVLACG